MRINYKTVQKKNLNTCSAIERAFKRKNSLAMSALVELISKGGRLGTEKAACEYLNINFKMFRYFLGKPSGLADKVKLQLGYARKYRATIRHESLVRKHTKKARSLL